MRTRIVLLLLILVLFGAKPVGSCTCGDIDCSGQQDIADIVYLVNYMFVGGTQLPFWPSADCDASGAIDIADLVCWVNRIFGDGPVPTCGYYWIGSGESLSGTCLDSSSAAQTGDDRSRGSLRAYGIGDSLFVYHDDAFYQCCLGYKVDFYISDHQVWVIESDTGVSCDCYCKFNLSAKTGGFAPGEYTVTLIGLDGEIVGSTIVLLGEAGLLDLEVDECIPWGKDWPWDEDPEVIYYWHDGVLEMRHTNAFFNCNLELDFSWGQDGNVIWFFEDNVSEVYPLPCMCYYPITARIGGVPPGTYTLRVYNRDLPGEPSYLLDEQVITFGR